DHSASTALGFRHGSAILSSGAMRSGHMCGIGGVFDWSDLDGLDARRVADDLDRALAHRGPDGAGCFVDRGVVLVHRSLAIIDLSPGGRQPMTTPDRRYSIVFNGEIYNYRELRAELERAGARFVTASD